jgi:hypothetical protein
MAIKLFITLSVLIIAQAESLALRDLTVSTTTTTETAPMFESSSAFTSACSGTKHSGSNSNCFANKYVGYQCCVTTVQVFGLTSNTCSSKANDSKGTGGSLLGLASATTVCSAVSLKVVAGIFAALFALLI